MSLMENVARLAHLPRLLPRGAGWLALGAAALAIEGLRRQRRQRELTSARRSPTRLEEIGHQAPDTVDETSDQSFPASDPPSWSPVTGAQS